MEPVLITALLDRLNTVSKYYTGRRHVLPLRVMFASMRHWWNMLI